MRPVSGRERQPSLAWRESKRPSRGDDFVISGIQSSATPAVEGTGFSPGSCPSTVFPGQEAVGVTPRRPLSAGMAGISRKAFHPSTPDAQALGAGCRDGGSDLALRGAAPRPPTTGRTGRTMGVRTVTPGGCSPRPGRAGRCGPRPRCLNPCSGGCNPSKDPPRAVARVAIGCKACPPGPAPQQFTQAIDGHGAGFRAPTCRVWPLKFRRFSPNQPGIGASNLVRLGATPRP